MTSDIIQGTDAWMDCRRAKVTASRVADVAAKTKSGYGASRANYMAQLIAEALTGTTADSFTNAAMQWGTDTEPQARAAYEFAKDVDVVEVGFIDHPTIEGTGASPDGLILGDGLVEIKCPTTSTHIDTLLGQKTPKKYITQMMWQLACTGRKWCDFVSFDPRLTGNLNIFIQRVERDDELIAELETEVKQFIEEMKTKIEALEKL